jgi:hypothetical protein
MRFLKELLGRLRSKKAHEDHKHNDAPNPQQPHTAEPKRGNRFGKKWFPFFKK